MTALQDKILKRKLKKREKQKLKVIQDRAKPGQTEEDEAGSGAEEEQNRYYKKDTFVGCFLVMALHNNFGI